MAKWTSTKIPQPLMNQIKEAIESGILTHHTANGFVVDSVRNALRDAHDRAIAMAQLRLTSRGAADAEPVPGASSHVVQEIN